jgi:hypothetical protein
MRSDVLNCRFYPDLPVKKQTDEHGDAEVPRDSPD